MKSFPHFLLCCCLFFSAQLFAQTEEAAPNTTNTAIIIKTTDKEGNESLRSITKEGDIISIDGDEINLKDLDIYIKSAQKNGNINIDIDGDFANGHALFFEDPNSFWIKRQDCDSPFLGVMMTSRTYKENGVEKKMPNIDEGVFIDDVIKNTGAEEAGLLAHDILTALDGKAVKTLNDVIKEVKSHKVGDQITVDYLRSGKAGQVVATLKGKKCPEESIVELQRDAQVERAAELDLLIDKLIQIKTEKDETKNAITAEEEVEKAPLLNVAPQQKQNLRLDEIDVFPNPSIGWVTVAFTGVAKATTVRIVDVAGKEIYREELPLFDGNYRKEIDIREAAKGTLFLNIVQGDKVHTEKIIFN